MSVIKRENSFLDPKPQPIAIQNVNGQRYILEEEKATEDETKSKIEALQEELEYERNAKKQAVEINYRLENKIREYSKEIERLNEEINELNKIYKKSLDENRELEDMKDISLRLVYYFCKRELGL